MIYDGDSYLDDRQLAIELLHSIRDIYCRIDELRMLIDANGLQQEKRKKILSRIAALIETRSCLVDSLQRVTGRNPDLVDSTNPFDYLQIQYEDLKNEIFKFHPDIEEKVKKRNE